LSRDKVFKFLIQIGLSQPEADVYLYLAIKGPRKAEDLSEILRLPSPQLYGILQRLQERGAISAAPSNFVALPFEEMLDALAKARLEEAQDIEKRKSILLSQWRSFVCRNSAS
jgi:sugar-specific transcriptional regulator TrmB